MRVECTKCGEKFDNRVGHKCAPRKSAPKAKTEAKTSPVLIRSLETLMAMKSSKPITAAGREKAAKEPDKEPDKPKAKTWADKAKAVETKLKAEPDNVGLRVQVASTKRMAARERAEAFQAEQTKLLPHASAKTSTARTAKWREANKAKATEYHREYMRKYRAKEETA